MGSVTPTGYAGKQAGNAPNPDVPARPSPPSDQPRVGVGTPARRGKGEPKPLHRGRFLSPRPTGTSSPGQDRKTRQCSLRLGRPPAAPGGCPRRRRMFAPGAGARSTGGGRNRDRVASSWALSSGVGIAFHKGRPLDHALGGFGGRHPGLDKPDRALAAGVGQWICVGYRRRPWISAWLSIVSSSSSRATTTTLFQTPG
jgi:hypothetical protein